MTQSRVHHSGGSPLVITRRNDRTLTTRSDAVDGGFVRNGDRWQIAAVHHDGSVDVRREGDGADASLTLPADYVAEHLDLGYAVTAHRAQGLTVDSAHVLVTPTTTRENLYVALTRGRDTNRAYVALDEPTTNHDPQPEDATTARSILFGVLQHSGVELSAHQMRKVEHDKWSGIAQLAAEYDTIANLAQRDRWTQLVLRTFVTGGRLTPSAARAATESESFGSLCIELRRTEASGHDPHAALMRVVGQRNLLDADDPSAVVVRRLTRDSENALPTRRTTPMIAGLIPPALGPMPVEVRNAVAERARLIEERAMVLARTAIRQRAGWVQRMEYVPTLGDRGPAPREFVAVAAYRDRYGITGHQPLGPKPADPRQARDRETAHVALRVVAQALYPSAETPQNEHAVRL